MVSPTEMFDDRKIWIISRKMGTVSQWSKMERPKLMHNVQGLLTISGREWVSQPVTGLCGMVALIFLASCAGSDPTTTEPSATQPEAAPAIAPQAQPKTATPGTTASTSASTTPAPKTSAPSSQAVAPSPQAATPPITPASPAQTPAAGTSPTIAAQSANTVVVPSRCHMGECVELHYQGKSLVKEVGNEKLYKIEVQTYLSPMGNYEGGEFWPKAASEMVLCSTERPLLVHQESVGDPYNINQLNPGPNPPGYLMEAHMLYWMTCHDEAGPDFFTLAMEEKAQGLGYPLNLTTDQNESEFFEPFEG